MRAISTAGDFPHSVFLFKVQIELGEIDYPIRTIKRGHPLSSTPSLLLESVARLILSNIVDQDTYCRIKFWDWCLSFWIIVMDDVFYYIMSDRNLSIGSKRTVSPSVSSLERIGDGFDDSQRTAGIWIVRKSLCWAWTWWIITDSPLSIRPDDNTTPCEVEIEILGAPIGKQDQYGCAYGGLKFIQFNSPKIDKSTATSTERSMHYIVIKKKTLINKLYNNLHTL